MKQGVIASKMGRGLYNKLGWKEFTLKEMRLYPQGVSIAVMEYDPMAREL
jgi:hypothetical protein